MTDFLLGAAFFVLLTVGFDLVPILRGPSGVDRLMSAQLLGTGGIAILLLVASATEMPAVIDICVVLALLSAFVSAGFAKYWESRKDELPREK